MKGFLAKDYRLLLAQRNLFIVLPIGLLFMFTNDTPVMGISYTLYVLTFLSTTLLSYDTFDNGMAYLLTLPGGRKTYVTEKYVFILINTTVGSVLLATIGSLLELSRSHGITAVQETYMGTFLLAAVALAFAFIILPLQLKFGPEKSRVVMLILFAVVFLGSSLLNFVATKLNLNLNSLENVLEHITITTVALMTLLFVIIFTLISWSISQKIMSKKEF